MRRLIRGSRNKSIRKIRLNSKIRRNVKFKEEAVRLRVARHHPHHKHEPRSGSQDHHPSKNSVQKTIRCNSTSNAPDDGRINPKNVELRVHQ